MLALGELGDYKLTAASVTFASTVDGTITLGGHGRQGGATARAGGARDVAGVWRYDAVRRYARGPSRTGRVMSWLTNGFWAYCGSPASSISG